MYWGRNLLSPSVFVWLFRKWVYLYQVAPFAHISTVTDGIVWDSFAQCMMREGSPSYHAELVSRLDALVDDPSRKYVYHLHFSESSLLSCIEAPVTQVTITVLEDAEDLDTWNHRTDLVISEIRALCMEGFLGSTHARPPDDVKTIVYIAGWESSEVCASVAHSYGIPLTNWLVNGEIDAFEARHGRLGESSELSAEYRGVDFTCQRLPAPSCPFRTAHLTCPHGCANLNFHITVHIFNDKYIT
jgi:hypothetical protein